MKSRFLAISFILVVFLSGCITPSTAGGGPVSVSFEADSTNVPEGGAPVGVAMSVENNALNPISSISASIYAPSGWTISSSPSPPSSMQREGVWEGVWIVTSPTDVLTDTPYTIYGTLTYQMMTRRAVSLTVVSYEYYKRTKTKSSISTVTSDTGGPLGISFSGVGQLSYMYTGQPSKVPFKVVINNRGGGKAFWDGSSPSTTNLNYVNFAAQGPGGGVGVTCSLSDSKVYLTKDGSSATVSCTLDIPAITQEVLVSQVTITLQYNYVHDLKTQTITVTDIPTFGEETSSPEGG